MEINVYLSISTKKTANPSETAHLSLWHAVCCCLYFTREGEGIKSVSTYVFHNTTHNLYRMP